MLSYDQFIEKLKQKFNNKIQINFNELEWNWSIRPLDFICSDHGPFTRKPNEVIKSKYGCRLCGQIARARSNKQKAEKMEIPLQEHIKKFRVIFGDKYHYPEQEIKNGHSKIKIICPVHGEFKKHIHAHHKGRGCPTCNKKTKKIKIIKTEQERIESVINANRSRTTSISQFKERCQLKFGNKFEYDESTYVKLAKPMKIICHQHGEFWMKPYEHLYSAHGCPSCASAGSSNKEKIWLESQQVTTTQYVIKLHDKTIKVDGYKVETNSVYEFLGDYWHGNPIKYKCNDINKNNKFTFKELFEQTQERFLILSKLGYSIYYLWENDLDNKLTELREFKGSLEWL